MNDGQLPVRHPEIIPSIVSIRVLSDLQPQYLLFSVRSGIFQLASGSGQIIKVLPGDKILITRYDGKIAVRTRIAPGFVVDSLIIRGLTGSDNFSLRTYGAKQVSRNYTGDLRCYPDMGTVLLLNDCDIECYLAGVVKSEGGSGKNEEYFKTQAVIARTYTCKYFNKHIKDGFNLCDDIHCQAFDGITTDTIIRNSVTDTRDLVITTPDSCLIMSAFHSNCGGETSPSQYVWLTDQPYLSKVIDPYCMNSRNAVWKKTISLTEWKELLKRNGYKGGPPDVSLYNFEQPSRVPDYIVGAFILPLRILRSELDLRSTFFSVSVNGDSVLLSGRGYGHGVGLCQEGAMVMSVKGFTFEDIIRFYYPGVRLIRIQDARKTENEK
jgi:stage II sporulation protein D